jgi:hypothetical protein
VADHVAVLRPFAAEITLQCHDVALPKLQKIENTSLNSTRSRRKRKTPSGRLPHKSRPYGCFEQIESFNILGESTRWGALCYTERAFPD